jgi:choline dehydrogenase-like flavoprotein
MDITAQEYRRATEVTCLGAVHGTMAALKRMVPRDRGSIVQIGSALSYRAIPLQSAYCGAKFAIRGFTDSVRTELLHRDESGTVHLAGTCRMGTNPRNSVTNSDGRTWDIPNPWVCDGSLFPTSNAVNPSLTIQALACRIGDRIKEMAARGEL